MYDYRQYTTAIYFKQQVQAKVNKVLCRAVCIYEH